MKRYIGKDYSIYYAWQNDKCTTSMLFFKEALEVFVCFDNAERIVL